MLVPKFQRPVRIPTMMPTSHSPKSVPSVKMFKKSSRVSPMSERIGQMMRRARAKMPRATQPKKPRKPLRTGLEFGGFHRTRAPPVALRFQAQTRTRRTRETKKAKPPRPRSPAAHASRYDIAGVTPRSHH